MVATGTGGRKAAEVREVISALAARGISEEGAAAAGVEVTGIANASDS